MRLASKNVKITKTTTQLVTQQFIRERERERERERKREREGESAAPPRLARSAVKHDHNSL